MKLDAECVRSVLLELEEKPLGVYLPDDLSESFSKYGMENVEYAILKLNEAGYIRAGISETLSGDYEIFGILDITFNGHEFLNSIRSPSVWERLKDSTLDGGTACLKVVGDIAVEILKEIAKEKLHLS